MKLKALAISIALAISTNIYAADPGVVSITVDGSTYRVYAQELTSLPDQDFIYKLESTAWYGSPPFDFRDAVANAYFLASNGYEPMKLAELLPDYVNFGPFVVDAIFFGNTIRTVASSSGTFIGSYGTFQYWLDSANAVNSSLWFLLQAFGPSAEDTLASMQPNASAMKNAFNSQYATLAYGLNHDCTVYDSNGVCVSVFGRNTSLNDSSYDNNAAGLVLGYKPHAQFRIGTYIDQSLNSNTTGGVKVERSNPDVGVFGVWNMNVDGSGLELRAAANYGKRDVDVTRTVAGTAEAGSGKSDLNAYGALLEASYAYAMNDSWTAKPYAGVRYLTIKRDSYTEASSDTVQNPLSYSGLKQETTSAIAGVRFNGRLAPKVMASLNAGLEHDLHHSIDDYRATGVDGLGSIDMNSQKDRTRPTAGMGIAYDVADKQRVAANVQYRKEVFMSESSTTGQITYTIGF